MNNPTNPKVVVSVLNWNNYQDTIDCLNSLLTLDYSNFEIIVVDNASIDDSVRQIKNAFPDISLIKSKSNEGYGAGNELALQEALKKNADLFWVVNNDAVVFKDTLSTLVNAYQRHGEQIFGSIILDDMEDERIQFAGGFLINSAGELDKNSIYNPFAEQKLSEVEDELQETWVSEVYGSSFLVPISLVRKHGFIDPSFFLYNEEVDYCYRLRKNHKIKTIIVPSSKIWHKESQSFQKSKDMKYVSIYYRSRSDFRFMKAHNDFKFPTSAGLSYLSYFIKYAIKKLVFNRSDKELYFSQLGAFHAYLNIKGRYVVPEKFL